MRRTTTVAVALLAAAAAAPGARAAEGARQSGTFTWTSTRPGAPTGYGMAVDFYDPADPAAKPHTLKTLIVRFPKGALVDTTALPQCKATDAELYLEGTGACPADTRIGGGTIVTDTGSTMSGVPRYAVNDVTPFNNQAEVIGVAASQTAPPVRAGTRARRRGTAVSRSKREGEASPTEIPVCPGNPPPEPFTAFRRLRLSVPAIVRNGRAYALTPPTCPRPGFWTIEMTFAYYDGVNQSIASRSPC